MPGPKFFETGYGKRFFESQLPELIKNIGRVATAMEKQAIPRIIGTVDLYRPIKLPPSEMSDREVCIAVMDLIAQEYRNKDEEVPCYAQMAHMLLAFVERHIPYHAEGGPTGDNVEDVENWKFVSRLREVAAKQKNMMEGEDAAAT